MAYFINNFLKFVFLLTPFFVLSMFLSMTQGWAMRQKRLLALRIGIAAFCTCMILLFFGKWIFVIREFYVRKMRQLFNYLLNAAAF